MIARLKVKIEELFYNNQIKLMPKWYESYGIKAGRVGGKVVSSLPMEFGADRLIPISEAALLLGSATNTVSELIEKLDISFTREGRKILIDRQAYERLAEYRTRVFYSMVARWMLVARSNINKQMLARVNAEAANNQIISRINESLWRS